MANRHELQAYDYVNHPYAAVRDALSASPLTVFRQATTVAAAGKAEIGAELHAKAGPLDVGAEIAIEVLAIEDARSPDKRPATSLVMEWKAARRPELFPTMRARLMLYALTATETQLDLSGTYDPPLGVVGEALDAIALHRLARDSVDGFVRDLAAFLRASLASGK